MFKDNPIQSFCLFFVKRFRITILLFIATITLGLLSYSTFLNREGFPEIEVPFGVVRVPYFVNDAELVNQQVSTPIEQVLPNVKGIKEFQSITSENFAIFTIEFESGVSSEEGIERVQNTLSRSITLPQGAEPVYQPINSSQFFGSYDVLLSLTSDNASYDDLFQRAQELAQIFQNEKSVAKAEPIELTTTEVNPITGEPISIQTSFNRVGLKTSDSGIEFKDAISIGIVRSSSEKDIITFSDGLKEVLAALPEYQRFDEQSNSHLLSDGYQIVFTADFAEAVNSQILSLESNGVSGWIAVVLVVFLFISLRASIISGIFIPVVMAATFVALYLLGYTLNVIVLFSLILVLGLIVDDAIVVIESIDYYNRKGYKGLESIRAAIKAVGTADILGSITTILVFAPLIFTTGVLGDFIRLIPITVVSALLLSLLIALTFIPILSILFKLQPLSHFTQRIGVSQKAMSRLVAPLQGFMDELGRKVAYFVRWYLTNTRRMVLVFLIVIGFVAIGMSYASKLSFTVFPTPKDSDTVQLNVTFPEGTTIQQAQTKTVEVEKIIASLTIWKDGTVTSSAPEFAKDVISRVDYYNGAKDGLTVQIRLSPIDERLVTANDFVDTLQREIDENVEGLTARVAIVSAGPPVEEYPFAMQLFSEDLESLEPAGEALTQYIKNNVALSGGAKVTETLLTNVSTINKLNGKRFINIKAKYSTDENVSALNLELEDVITAIYESNTDSSDIRAKLEFYGITQDDLGFDAGQETENLDSFNSTIFALIVSLIAMYGLLVLQYNSFTQPLLIFLAIPLSFPLLFPGLYYTDNALSFFSMLGIIGLVGIVVNNTIMLVDFANQAVNDGKSPVEAIVGAVEVRLRPVITTTLTTVAGLLPLAISDPFWESLAAAIILGLVSSTFLVITAFPLFYIWVEKLRSLKRFLPQIEKD